MTKIVPIDSIWVDRVKRQRRELKNIPQLADSIKRTGRMIHPPTIVGSTGELRAGERRLEAAKLLGWTSIEVSTTEDMEEVELQLLEYEENVGRVDLDWTDACMAVLGFHELHVQLDPEWNRARTAEALGVPNTSVSEKIAVALELRGNNKMVREAPKYSTARGIVTRKAERQRAAGLQAITLTVNPAKAEAGKIVPLLNANFHEWAAVYNGPKFNFLHCDFPYGVNADEHAQGQAAAQGGYVDTLEVYEALIATLGNSMTNVVDSSAHLMFWFSMDYYQFTLDTLTKAGWTVNPFPLIWIKNDGTGILPDPQRGPRRGYETAFLASRGDRKIVRAKTNWVSWPGKDKDIHMSEKPVGMLKHFMEMLVDEYTVMLDPTAGSANALKAASTLGARSVFGLEQDTEFYNRAKEAYYGTAD